MTDYWWPPSRIYYLRDQVIWLVGLLDDLEVDRWPPEPGDSDTLNEHGYLTCAYIKYDELPQPILVWEVAYKGSYEIQYQRHGRAIVKAPFIDAAEVYAEMTERLKTTGEAGEALIDEVRSGITQCDYLSRPAQRACNYLSRERRRRQTYPQWRATVEKRKKSLKVQ